MLETNLTPLKEKKNPQVSFRNSLHPDIIEFLATLIYCSIQFYFFQIDPIFVLI